MEIRQSWPREISLGDGAHTFRSLNLCSQAWPYHLRSLRGNSKIQLDKLLMIHFLMSFILARRCRGEKSSDSSRTELTPSIVLTLFCMKEHTTAVLILRLVMLCWALKVSPVHRGGKHSNAVLNEATKATAQETRPVSTGHFFARFISCSRHWRKD